MTNNFIGIVGGGQSGYAKDLRLVNNRNGAILDAQIAPVVFKDSLIASDPGLPTPGWDPPGFELRYGFAVLRNTTIRGFPYGVKATSSLVRLTGSTITGNATALLKGNDTRRPYIESSGDNVIRGNTDDALGALSPGALH